MKVDYRIDENQRVTSMIYPSTTEHNIDVNDIPEKVDDWKIIDGKMIFDPLRVEEATSAPTYEDLLAKVELLEGCVMELAELVYS